MNDLPADRPRLHLLRHLVAWSLPSGLETAAKVVSVGTALAVLPKEEFGIVSLAMLAFSYAGFLQVGATDALMLRLPDLYVRKDFTTMAVNLSTAMRFAARNIIVVALAIVGGIALFAGEARLTLALGAYFVSAVVYQIYLHHLLANRYIYKLGIAAQARAVIAFNRGVVQVGAVIAFGLYGFLAAEALVYLPALVLLRIRGHMRLDHGSDRAALRDLVKTGLPIVAVGAAGAVALTLDRWVATTLGGLEGIAVYGAAAYIATLLAFLPGQALSFFSQYAREMLAHGRSRRDLADLFFGFTIIVAALWGGLSLLVVDGGGWAIPRYLAKYADVLPLLPYVVVIALLRIVTANDMTLLIISDRSRVALAVNCSIVAAIAALNGLFYLAWEPGLMGVVLATLGSVVLQFLLLAAIRLRGGELPVANFLILLVILGLSAANLLLAHEANVAADFAMRAGLMIGVNYTVALALPALAVAWLWRRGEFHGLLAFARREF